MSMRRRSLPAAPALHVWAALIVLAVTILTSCSGERRAADDGGGLPKVGDCFADDGAPVSCEEPHVAQSVFVSDEPPGRTSTALAPCRTAQAHFLGEDLNTRLDLKLWMPADGSWYRCDVLLRNSTGEGSGHQALTETLQGVLKKAVPVSLQACLDAPYDPLLDQDFVPCSEPHTARELVVAPAIGTLREPFPGDLPQRATNACNATAAAEGHLVDGHHVAAYYPKNADAWTTGERTADCWVTATRGKLPPVAPSRR